MKYRKTIIVELLILLSIHCFRTVLAQQDNWPQFRGPNCCGIADENAKPPVELNEKTLLWKTALPIGHSSPCIWEDNIFLTAFVKEKSELQTICIDRITGDIKWKKSIFPEKIERYHAISNAAQTSPATDGERVYVYFGSYGILCYSVEGLLIWDYKINVHPHHWGVATSPTLYKDMLILSRDIRDELYLLALNKKNGETIWKADLVDLKPFLTTSWATPIVYKDQIVLHRLGEIAAYSSSDGHRIWSIPIQTNGTSTPIIHKGIIYIGTWHNVSEKEARANLPHYRDFSRLLQEFDANDDGLVQKDELPDSLYLSVRPEISDSKIPGADVTVSMLMGSLDKDKNGAFDRSEWQNTIDWTSSFYQDAGLIAINPQGEGELPLDNLIWRELEKVPEVPSPICCNGYVYMCKNGGILTCMDAQNGEILYRENITAKGPYFASPVAANGRIYISSGKGMITTIKASDKLEILAQNDLKEKIFASPAIVDNTIYIRTTQHLSLIHI